MFDVLILCGGKSSRMGANKSLLPVNNMTLIENLISQLNIEGQLFLSVTDDKDFPKISQAIFVQDFLDESYQGPLSGIVNALKKSQTDYLLVLSGDMIELPSKAIFLLESTAENNDSDIVCLKDTQGRTYPLIGLWNKRVVNKLEDYLLSGERRVMSFMQEVNAEIVESTELNSDLCNVNTPEQYQRALNQLRSK